MTASQSVAAAVGADAVVVRAMTAMTLMTATPATNLTIHTQVTNLTVTMMKTVTVAALGGVVVARGRAKKLHLHLTIQKTRSLRSVKAAPLKMRSQALVVRLGSKQ